MDTLINPEIRVQNPGHFWLRQQKFERSRVLRVGGAMRSIVVLCTVVEHVKKLKMQEWKTPVLLHALLDIGKAVLQLMER